MADDIKIRINELFLRVKAATLAKQYNVVEELTLPCAKFPTDGRPFYMVSGKRGT